MPTILRLAGYRFHFYSHEPNEPRHVHVDKAGWSAKLWLGLWCLPEMRASRRRKVECSSEWFANIRPGSRRLEMPFSASAADTRVKDVLVGEDELFVRLMDGRTISVPIGWYPRLASATSDQRRHWEIAGGGYGIHWPDIDEDLSTEGLLRGAPAPRLG